MKAFVTPVRSTVLVISPSADDHSELCSMLTPSDWIVDRADSLAEARDLLRAKPCEVVITEARLEDRDWKSVLQLLAVLPDPPKLIVASPLADDYLWSEVLNRGGYNVLAKPFDRREVDWVMTQARMELPVFA